MSDAQGPGDDGPVFSCGNTGPDAFELVHGFVTASLQGELSDGEVEDFEALLRDEAELRRVYARYLETTAQIPRMLALAPSLCGNGSAPFDPAELSLSLPLSRSKSDATRSRSPLLAGQTLMGRLNGLLHAGRPSFREADPGPASHALMWMVMAVVCSGMVLTVFFCVSLAIHGVGVHVHVDGPDAASKEEGSKEQGAGRSTEQSPPNPLAAAPGSSHPALPPSEATVARLIHTAESRWAIGSHSPHVGDDLEPGRKLVLLSGLAEVMFQSGVRALLQGPATLEIDSRKSALLRQGKLTVRVEDPDARGFEIYAPGMRYTDLGTEFGLWVKKDGTQEMVVYRGSVQAEKGSGEHGAWSSEPDHGPTAAGSLLLTANQAIRVAGPDKAMERIEGESNLLAGGRFVRAMPAPVPFAVCSTGFGLDRGAADPHWEIANISTDANFKTQPAVVADPLPIYLRPGEPSSLEKSGAQWPASQWIGKSQALKRMPDACRCTYRTRFDLTGFDASTARIEGRLLADDYVAEIQLNGKAVPLPAGARGPYRYAKWLEFKIEEGFVDGDNTLEIVIENSSNAQQGFVNTMALCVECKGTARPLLAGSR